MVTLRDSLTAALFGKTRRAVLGLLFTHPTERFHLRQIVRLSGAGLGPVQRDVGALTRAGILRRERQGMHVLYQANDACPVFAEIKSLVLKTAGAAGVVQAALQPLAGRIALAFLYGSVARGEEHAESDIDLLVVSGDLALADLVRVLKPAQQALHREINPMLYRPDEYRRKLRARHHFLTQVLRQPRIVLIGDDHEPGRVA